MDSIVFFVARSMKAESDIQVSPRNEVDRSAMFHLPFTMLNALKLYFSWLVEIANESHALVEEDVILRPFIFF